MDKLWITIISMKLDTNLKTYTPDDADKYGKTPTLFTKYVFREWPGYDSDSDDEKLANKLDESMSMIEEKPNTNATNVPLKLKDEQFPRILFLGTGAADSFLLRNSSAVLVHIS